MRKPKVTVTEGVDVKMLTKILPIALMLISVYMIANSPNAQAKDINGTGRELIQYCNSANYQRSNHGDLNVGWIYCVGAVHGVVIGWKLGFTVGRVVERSDFLPKNQSKKGFGMTVEKYGYCIPDEINREQVALVVMKYLKNYPKELNQSESTLIFSALQSAWPCHKGK